MAASPDPWRALDQQTLDREYSPSSCIPDLQRYLREYDILSEEARRTLEVRTNLRYGNDPVEVLDFFPAQVPNAPVHVFVHGGNWQAVTKDASAFPAGDFVGKGVAYAAVNYGLAPAYSLDQMVQMIRGCLQWLHSHAGELGFHPGRIFLSGASAGAHLAAMALCPAEREAPGSMPHVAGVTLMSGIYDLMPVRHSYINAALKLDDVAAQRNSPLFRLPDTWPPVVLARGGVETREYCRQHELLKQALQKQGTLLTEVVEPERNHFDLTYDLGVQGTPLGDAVLAQMNWRHADEQS